MAKPWRTIIQGWLLWFLWGVAWASTAQEQRATESATSSFQSQPCAKALLPATDERRVDCGVLTVPRDWSNAAAGSFDLAVVRLTPSKQTSTTPPPLLYLHGGPGGSSTDQVAALASIWPASQPLILLDQRGGGRSLPRWCEASNAKLAALVLGATDDATWQQSRHDLLQQCIDELKNAGVSATFFGAMATVQDAEALRKALAIDQWDLYGVSYGSVVALQYAQYAPAAVRRLILDSPYPPDEYLHSFSQNQHYLIGQLQQHCRAQAACQQQFGDLNQLYQRVLAQLETDPLMMSVQTLEKPFVLTPLKLQYLLNLAAMQRQSLTLIPWWLDAVRRQDRQALQSLLSLALGHDQLNVGVFMYTECLERPRFAASSNATDPLEAVMGFDKPLCQSVGEFKPLRWPEQLAQPSLILSGALDLFQPDSARLANLLGERSSHVLLPLALHGVIADDACARQTMMAFLQTDSPWQAPACATATSNQALVLAASSDADLVLLWQQLWAGHLPWALLAMLLCMVLACAMGVLWPLLRVTGLTLSGQVSRVQLGPMKASSALLCFVWIASYSGFVAAINRVLQLQTGELWVGLPESAVLWQRLLVVWMLPSALVMHRAFRLRAVRQGMTQLAWLLAAFFAMTLHLLP